MVALLISGIILHLPWWLIMGPVGVGVISFFDDRLDLSAKSRLVVQFVVAGFVIYMIPLHEWAGGVWGVGLKVFWVFFVVGTANFYNFMDGINGIAGITGAIAFCLLGLFVLLSGANIQPEALFCFGMAMACLGFLPHNFPHAKVFMGDVGSISLGFVFGALICLLTPSVPEFLCLTFFLFLFYADTLTTLFFRWRAGEKLSQAHRKHLYQIFVNELKRSHHSVALGYGVIQLLLGGLMLLAWNTGWTWQVGLWGFSLAVFLFVSLKVRNFIRIPSAG